MSDKKPVGQASEVGQASVPVRPAQQDSSSPLDPQFPGHYLDDATLYRRHLPHLRLDGATYFLTWRVISGKIDLSPPERDIVKNVLHHFDAKRYHLYAFVIMNDHVHVLFEPLPPHTVSQITHTWKSFTARQIQKSDFNGLTRFGPVWQNETFDRIVRTESEFAEKLYYILNNPSKRWPDLRDYLWLWAAKPLADEVGIQGRPPYPPSK